MTMQVEIVTTNSFGGGFPCTEKLSVFTHLIQVDTLDGKFEVPISDCEARITIKADSRIGLFVGACVLAVKGTLRVLVKDRQITCEGLDESKFTAECKYVVACECKLEEEKA
jgi:hypothetical protein